MLPVAGPGKGRRKIVCLEAFLAMPARAFSPLPPGGGGEGPGPPMLAQGCPDRATPLVGVTHGSTLLDLKPTPGATPASGSQMQTLQAHYSTAASSLQLTAVRT